MASCVAVVCDCLPSIFVGKRVAAYILDVPLEAKVADLVHSIFCGLAVFGLCYYYAPLALSKIVIGSIGASLVFLFMRVKVNVMYYRTIEAMKIRFANQEILKPSCIY